MESSDYNPAIDWSAAHIKWLDERYRFRITYRRKAWKLTSTQYLYFNSARKAWEWRERLLANELGFSPIEFVKLEPLPRVVPDGGAKPRRSRRRGAK